MRGLDPTGAGDRRESNDSTLEPAIRAMTRAAVLLACALLAGAPIAVASVEPAPQRVALSYPAELAAAGFPSPMLRWTVNGRSAWFLVDSGAGVPVLASWFVEAAGIELAASDAKALDSSGRAVELREAREVRGVLADGSSFALARAAVADFPPIFREHELGGLLSPQLLAPPDRAAILDLRVPELSFEPFAAAAARLGAAVDTARWAICHDAGSPFDNLLFAAPAVVGGTSCRLLLDSGASSTQLHEGTAAALALATRATGTGKTMGVHGDATESRTARDTTVELAGRTTRADIEIGAGKSSCPADGLLGMDVLRRCALLLGRSSAALVCDSAAAEDK